MQGFYFLRCISMHQNILLVFVEGQQRLATVVIICWPIESILLLER